MIVLWLKRFSWLVAWGTWLCCGYALFIVFPRALDPPLGTLDLEPGEEMLGFVKSEPLIATHNAGTSTVRVWNAPFATLIHTRKDCRWVGAVGQPSPIPFFSHRGLVLTKGEANEDGVCGLETVNVLTGKRRRMQVTDDGSRSNWVFHDARPWLMGTAPPSRLLPAVPDPNDVDRVVVFDVDSGKLLCALPPLNQSDPKETCYQNAHFLPGTDLVAVDRWDERGQPEADRHTLEIWKAPFGPAPQRRFHGRRIWVNSLRAPTWIRPRWSSFSRNERVALAGCEGVPTSDVLDLKTGEFVFADPPREVDHDRQNNACTVPYVDLSPDGRMLVVSTFPSTNCWDVNARTRLPDLGDHETIFVEYDFDLDLFDSPRAIGTFSGVRWWNDLPWTWLPKIDPLLEIHVVRALRTRRFLYSCTGPSIPHFANERWSFRLEGNVVQPVALRVRWGWIAAIQAVLATPMLCILGFAARKRRKRKLKSASGPHCSE